LRGVASFEDNLTFHIARKKILHMPPARWYTPVKLTKPNGMKIEMFVFDVFPYMTRFAVLEIARADELSPLKNMMPRRAVTVTIVTCSRSIVASSNRLVRRYERASRLSCRPL
jgi:UDP-N-acetylglucosamine pyrophosphorylase